MYETHFGLTRRPFQESTAPSLYIALPSRQAILRRLRYALESVQGPALLVGDSGTGKTLLAKTLADDLGGPAAIVTFPALPANELIAFVADEFQSQSGDASNLAPSQSPTNLVGELRRLRDWLTATVDQGVRPLLIVDDAHLIQDPSVFETLFALLNFSTKGVADLLLLIVGTQELLSTLPEGLAGRLAARSRIPNLNELETIQYLEGRIALADSGRPNEFHNREHLFPAETIRLLHQAAEGNPRRLNRIADLALLISFAEGDRQVSTRSVMIAARDTDPDAELNFDLDFELDQFAA